MVTRITYLGCEDGTPPQHAWKHPVTGDVLGFNMGRPILIDLAQVTDPVELQFYTDVITAVTADDHFRVEDIADNELPHPISGVHQEGYSPGQGIPGDYVPPASGTMSAAQGMRAERAEPKSSRRERGE